MLVMATVMVCACTSPHARQVDAGAVESPVSLLLMTSPRHVYKENDGRDGKGPTESAVFRIVVRGPAGPGSGPNGATVALRSAGAVVKTIHYSAAALTPVHGFENTPYSDDHDALYAVRLLIREPVVLAVDSALVTLEAGGTSWSLVVPIGVYAQRTKLHFPIRGDFMVVTGHATAEGGHQERSQNFAFDAVGLGPHLELLRGDGTKNTDFVGYGRDVLAPADGVVVYARNDVPDNPASGSQDFGALLLLPDPPWGVAGNCVVIDHQNGEFSLLAHMQPGSVTVKKGDRVKQDGVLGRLGNSGATTGPHLHYHLMDGPLLLRSDGLPARFTDTCVPVPKPGQWCDAH
jgi:murein DD-endopeptidase MepM/ murein hydrolase activator NlpD